MSAATVPASYWLYQRTLDLFMQVTTADTTCGSTLLTGTLLSSNPDGTVECLAENVALAVSGDEWQAVLDSRCEAHRDTPIGFGDEIELRLVVR